jgi:diacylglycerol O-acyltransferase
MEAPCARLHSSLLDRSRPLWEFYLIEGLADGRLGFYSKVHHAAVDGQAAVAMANSVYDLTPEPRRVKPPRSRRGHRHQLGVAELLGAARQALARRGAGVAAAAGPKRKTAPPTPFNVPITTQRGLAGVALPLGEVKAIGHPPTRGLG